MKALIFEAPEVMALREIDPPEVGDDDVLIRVAYSGICGSELSGFLGNNSLRTPPLVFGHELSGSVEQVGAGVPTDVVRPGDRVTANPLVSCGTCEYCVDGRAQLCASRLLLGASLPGCNAELVRVPASAVRRLPEGITLHDAAMTEPAACAVRAVEMSAAGAGSSALVVGAGPIGLFILQVLQAVGVTELYVAERNPARLALAEALGARVVAVEDLVGEVRRHTDGRGVDVAFDAVGAVQTRQDCLAATAPGGRVLFVGLHTDETPLAINSAVRSEITMQGVFGYTPVNFDRALQWMAEGRLGLREGVVVVPLSEAQTWYERLVAGDAASKVLLQPNLVEDEVGAPRGGSAAVSGPQQDGYA